MTKQQKFHIWLGFSDLETYHLAKALPKLHARQPPKTEIPKRTYIRHDTTPGVTYDKANGKWRAYAKKEDGKQKFLGSYKEKHHAQFARDDYMDKINLDRINDKKQPTN